MLSDKLNNGSKFGGNLSSEMQAIYLRNKYISLNKVCVLWNVFTIRNRIISAIWN